MVLLYPIRVTMATKSEKLFEEFCAENAIEYSVISVAEHKTPDYMIVIGGHQIVIEVKQVDPSKEDRRLLAELREGRFIEHGGTPGDRVRAKIKDAAPQLSRLAKGKLPTIIVLFNNLPFVLGNPTEPYFIKVGMFGLQSVIMNVPANRSESPKIVGSKFGPKRKLTASDNTTVSAVAVLDQSQAGDLSLRLYHNAFAAIPLSLGLFKGLRAVEYYLPYDVDSSFQDWEQVDG